MMPIPPPTFFTISPTPVPCRIRLLHPGYDAGDNVLLSFVVNNTTKPGLHHRIVLTACSVILGNAFGRTYLTRDRAGKDRVDATIPLDGMLVADDYWLQLEGYEHFREDGDQDARDGASSMPPPGPPLPSNTSTQSTRAQTPDPDTHTQTLNSPSSHTPVKHKVYPVVASVREWHSPEDEDLPQEWEHGPPGPPKPSSSAPHTDPLPPEAYQLYNDVCTPPDENPGHPPQLYFTHFAFSIFVHLLPFISSATPRHLILTESIGMDLYAHESHLRWMNGPEYSSFRNKPRSSCQMAQNNEGSGTEDRTDSSSGESEDIEDESEDDLDSESGQARERL